MELVNRIWSIQHHFSLKYMEDGVIGFIPGLHALIHVAMELKLLAEHVIVEDQTSISLHRMEGEIVLVKTLKSVVVIWTT